MNYVKACTRINGIGTLASPKRHFQVDASIIKRGFDLTTYRSNFQVKTLLQRGNLDAALKLFDEMPHKNTISTNTMIMGYINSGNLSTARSMFDSMLHRTVVTWTMLIGGYAQNNQFREAFGLFVEMCRHGTVPNHVTLATLLCGFTEFESVNEVGQVHAQVVKSGYDSTLMVCNSLLDSYCKTRNLRLACHLFKQMLEKDTVTFSALLTGYSKVGFNHDAINL
uniref:Pentatricopeptide repeat-containing protein At2g01510 family n=1 Tax=Cajanus cajan TaxID=3821 RepID=A0A151RHG6_CAJCA|nr:Putative pentatricopeptide repeat-containing protein At2g01510 family [Cajanus cajan]